MSLLYILHNANLKIYISTIQDFQIRIIITKLINRRLVWWLELFAKIHFIYIFTCLLAAINTDF
jgi:hypothetical protein